MSRLASVLSLLSRSLATSWSIVCFIVVIIYFINATVVVIIVVGIIVVRATVSVGAIAITSGWLDARFESVISDMPPVITLVVVVVVFENNASSFDKSLNRSQKCCVIYTAVLTSFMDKL